MITLSAQIYARCRADETSGRLTDDRARLGVEPGFQEAVRRRPVTRISLSPSHV